MKERVCPACCIVEGISVWAAAHGAMPRHARAESKERLLRIMSVEFQGVYASVESLIAATVFVQSRLESIQTGICHVSTGICPVSHVVVLRGPAGPRAARAAASDDAHALRQLRAAIHAELPVDDLRDRGDGVQGESQLDRDPRATHAALEQSSDFQLARREQAPGT